MAHTSVKISANSSDYQSQMKSAATQMRELTSEFKLAQAQAKSFSSAADALRAKAENLTAKIEVQKNIVSLNSEKQEQLTKKLSEQKTKQEELKTKIEAAKKAHEDSVKATGEDSEQSKALKEELEKLEQEFKNNETAIGKTETALSKQKTATNDAKTKLTEMEAELEKVNSELKNHKLNEFAASCDKAGQKMESFGKKMSVVSAGIAAIGAASIAAFKELDEGYDTIVTKTGATGEALVLLITTVYGTSAIHGIAGSRVDSSSLEIRPEDYDYVLHADGYGAAYETLKEEIENDPGTKEISEWGDGMFVASVPASVYGEEYWDALKEIYDLYYHKELTDEEFKKENPSETSVVNLLAVDEENLRWIAEKSGADAKRLLDTDHPAALVVKEGVISTDTYTISERTPEKYRLFSIENMTDLKLGDDIPMEIYDDEKGKNVAFPLENAGCVSEKDLSEFMTFGNDNQFIWLLVNTDVAKKIAGIVGGEDGTSAGISPELLIRVDEKRSDLVRRLEQLNGREDSGFYFAEAGVQDNLQHSLLQIADILLACFVVLTSVICLLNLFNSIRGWSEENTREFAVLRSVGMTKRQMEKMLLYECLGIILKAVLFAGVFAGLLVFFIRIGVTGIFGNLRIPFPVAETVLSAVLAGGVLVMFALLAHRRMNVREMRLMKME